MASLGAPEFLDRLLTSARNAGYVMLEGDVEELGHRAKKVKILRQSLASSPPFQAGPVSGLILGSVIRFFV